MMSTFPSKISTMIEFLSKMLDEKDHASILKTLGIETEIENLKMVFYRVECATYNGLSLLKFIDAKGDLLVSEGEELLELAVKIAELKHGGDQDKAMEEVMEHFTLSGVRILRNLLALFILQGKYNFVFKCLKGIKNPDVKGNHLKRVLNS